jgi:hypothetical protein
MGKNDTNGRAGRGRAAVTNALIAMMVEIAQIIQPCSVRALAYQLFNRKLIASMSKQDTAKVSRLSVIAREEGTLPWEWIVDSTRNEERVATWADPAAYGRAVMRSYRRNKWDAQPCHVAVWSEKGTVEGTLRPVLEKYEVPFQVLHGWSGATPVWDAASANLQRTKPTVILYVGDYDPSGMGMSELDLPRRLARYSTNDPSDKDMDPGMVAATLEEAQLSVRRIALTAADTRAIGPASRFPVTAKSKDSRFRWFRQRYGEWCWELDALSPVTLRNRVGRAILGELDPDLWDRYCEVEKAEQEAIRTTCQSWTSILQQDRK